jgi:L-ascorbate metabolism protein UlaG (beta-lactamase superfamily)
LRLFSPFRARPEHAPRSSQAPSAAFTIRWLGTAAHVLEGGGTTLLLDPFLSRPSLLRTATQRLEPTPERWWHHLPARVDAILLGHSHYDHLMDAPVIARRTGAKIIGSATTAAFARSSGVPEEQIVVVPPSGKVLEIGSATVRFVPSLHGRIALGRVPFAGEVHGLPRLPARLWDYRMGGAFGLHVTMGGRSVYHNGSADLVDAELEGTSADVLLVGLAGRRTTDRYLERLSAALRPGLFVPTHHDAFFFPLEDGVRLLPGIDLPGFYSDVRRLGRDARVITPTYEDVLAVPRDGAVGEAVLVHR